MAAAETWHWSDAWFLAALARTDKGEGASLADIMATADAMNHDVLNEDQVGHAVRCLSGSGLLEVVENASICPAQGPGFEPSDSVPSTSRASQTNTSSGYSGSGVRSRQGGRRRPAWFVGPTPSTATG